MSCLPEGNETLKATIHRNLREFVVILEFKDTDAARAFFDNTVKRLGDPDEVANLVAFVVSPRADYFNETDMRIDGGKSPSIN